jgi:membrane protease YdiL (CAAX protease family)
MADSAGHSGSHSSHHLVLGATTCIPVLVAFWFLARHFDLEARIGHIWSTFAAFALLFIPFWLFGFGGAQLLQRDLKSPAGRILCSGLVVIPYLVYSVPRDEFHWGFFLVCLAIPVLSCALFELVPPGGTHPAGGELSWQDVIVLAAMGLPVEFSWLRRGFPHPGLDSLPKLLLVDSALYAFLVVRGLKGVGYDLRPRGRELLIGLRELVFFAPIVLLLGITLRFISPHGGVPGAGQTASALLITFFFVALPEELYFRGLLQNLLEPRLGRQGALWGTAVIFGLSHFNKPGPFNWRYVLLATLAGVFYGRAWRDQRRLLASSTAHTLVDVLWALWFRA